MNYAGRRCYGKFFGQGFDSPHLHQYLKSPRILYSRAFKFLFVLFYLLDLPVTGTIDLERKKQVANKIADTI